MSHISDLRRLRGLDQTTSRTGEKVATAEARILLSSFNEFVPDLSLTKYEEIFIIVSIAPVQGSCKTPH